MRLLISFYLALFFFIFYLLSSSSVSASVCTNVATGNITGCASLRSTCHYSLPFNACEDGAPGQCSDYILDQNGCNASLFNCTYSTTTSLCTNTPLACKFLLSQSSCNFRSDCIWNTTSSKCINSLNVCHNATNQALCSVYGCFYDTYLQQCYNSLAEVTAINPCSSWTSFPLPNTACGFHGCMLDVTQTICLNAGSGLGNQTSASISVVYQDVNPRVLNNSMNFFVDIWIPNALNVNPGMWTYISMGGGIPGYRTSGGLNPNSACNNIGSYNFTTTPPLFVSVSDPVGLQVYFDNWINTNHTMTFNSNNVTFGKTLQTIMGPISVCSTCFDRTVSLDSSQQWVVHTVGGNILNLLNCSGVYAVYTIAGYYYSLPVDVIQRDAYNEFASSYSTYYVIINTAGQITVGATSTTTPVLSVSELTTVSSACPSTEDLLDIVYTIQYTNVFQSNVYVGPRNSSDILFTSPQFNNTLQNCYGLYVHTFSITGCFQSSCYVSIGIRSRCRVITSDGNAFNNCSYATASDRIADLGAGKSYPLSMNNQFTFWVNEYSCPSYVLTTHNYLNCTQQNISPIGFPDEMTSNIQVTILPQTTLNVQFDVFAGFLPTPFDTNLNDLEILSQIISGNITSQIDYRQVQLQWNAVLTFVAGMSASLQSVATLYIQLDSSLTITPLDVYANPIVGGKVLAWTDISTYLTYVPKLYQNSVGCVGCLSVPALLGQTAYDGFSIPVTTLRTLSPAFGYSITIDYYYTLPQPSYNTNNLLNHTPVMKLQSKTKINTKSKSKKFKTQSKSRSSSSNSSSRRFKVQTTTVNAPTPFTYSFIINDDTNPVPITSSVYNNVSAIVPLSSSQIQITVRVDSNSMGVMYNNLTAVSLYVQNRLIPAITNTLDVNAHQVININVLNNGGVLGIHPKLQYNNNKKTTFELSSSLSPFKPKASSKSNMKVASNVILSNSYYINFVIIPSPLNNITSADLASQLTSTYFSDFVSAMEAAGLAIDLSMTPQIMPVFVPTPDGYFTIFTTTTTAITPTESPASAWSWATGGIIIGSIVFFLILIFICIYAFPDPFRYYYMRVDSAASGSGNRIHGS